MEKMTRKRRHKKTSIVLTKNRAKNRFFALAFAFTFFVLGMLGVVVVFTLNPVEAEGVSGSISADGLYLPDEKDSLTTLLIGQQPGGDAPVFFALVRLDMPKGEILVLFLPGDTALADDAGYPTLASAYEAGGGAAAAAAFEKSYAISVPRYLSATPAAINEAVNKIGLVEYVLGDDLSYSGGGVNINLAAGKQLIDGQRFYDILRYPALTGDYTQGCRQSGELVAHYINSRFKVFTEQNADELVTALINLTDTNLAMVDYEARLPALKFLSKLTASPATGSTLTGGWNTQNHFIPDAASRRLLVQWFS